MKSALLIWLSVCACCIARADLTKLVEKEALAQGLDPKLVLAVIKVESNFNPKARGSKGEVGLLQLRPEFHKCASLDPKQNIKCGVKYLAKIKRKLKPVHGCAWVSFYNSGPYRRIKHPSKQRYFRKIKEAYPEFCSEQV
jgi:soluble lytic murein transglycosylase-like protein